jgi:guanosine-3',5'-bis(diphosphate) 3'-pyrophosphohydrolase
MINFDDMRIWQSAVLLSARAHQYQTRKDGVTPYISHPMRVCLVLSQVFAVRDSAILAAALLHDVIEDTATDYDDVVEACGKEVADIVAALSKDTRVEHDKRENLYRKQLAEASWKVKMIKIADVYDNLCDAAESRLGINMWSPAKHIVEDAGDTDELSFAVEALEQLMEKLLPVKVYLDGTLKKG